MEKNLVSVRLIMGEIALAGLSVEEERRIAQLEHHRILPDSELQQVEFLFKMFKKPCFARGNNWASQVRQRVARHSSVLF